ncbi:MAG TPA: sugar porter family MFS transporter [Cyclobacteriaceae bacterium]|nr:sugar porter family MFS transporter [Cyclobacteriaceae bacterium]
MKSNVTLISLVAAMGGFLFGFDTAVISGVEQTIQQLWKLDDLYHGLAVAIALYGTVIGALFAGIPTDRLGRKKTLFWVGVLYFLSALGSAVAPEVYSFMFFRFIGGLGVGASSVAAPMYISEIAPAKARGRLVALFQFNIVLGILVAFASNYLLKGTGVNDWRWMLGVEAIPAALFVALIPFIPRSPRWLIVKKNNEAEARSILERLDPDNVDTSIRAIRNEYQEAAGVARSAFFSPRYSKPILLVILFAVFNQVSGINAIIYYAPRIFEMTGLADSAALFSTVGIGLINLVFTLVGMVLIDRAGRRLLMLLGSVGLVTSLGLVAGAFYWERFAGVPLFLFMYIAFFALSQGAVIWVFISEIFPNEVRGMGQSLGSFTHWILAAVIANVFPYFANRFGGDTVFLFFMVMMVLQLLFVWFVMPETKGRTLEEIGRSMSSHSAEMKQPG